MKKEIYLTSFLHGVDGNWRAATNPSYKAMKHTIQHRLKTITPAVDCELEGEHSGPNANFELTGFFILPGDLRILQSATGQTPRSLAEAINNLPDEIKQLIQEASGFRIRGPLSEDRAHSPLYNIGLQECLIGPGGKITYEGASYIYTRSNWWTMADITPKNLPTEHMEVNKATEAGMLRMAIGIGLQIIDLINNPAIRKEAQNRAKELYSIYTFTINKLRHELGRDPSITEFQKALVDKIERLLIEQRLSPPQQIKLEDYPDLPPNTQIWQSLSELAQDHDITHIIAGDQVGLWESGTKRLAANLELKDEPYSQLGSSYDLLRLTAEAIGAPQFEFTELLLEHQEIATETYNRIMDEYRAPMRRLTSDDTLLFINTETGRYELKRKVDTKGNITLTIFLRDPKFNQEIPIAQGCYIKTEANSYALYVDEELVDPSVNFQANQPNISMLQKLLTIEGVQRKIGSDPAISLKAVALLPSLCFIKKGEGNTALLLPRYGSGYAYLSEAFIKALREKLPPEDAQKIPPVYVIRSHLRPYNALSDIESFKMNLKGPFRFLGYFFGKNEISSHEFAKEWEEASNTARCLIEEIKQAQGFNKYEILLQQLTQQRMANPEYIEKVQQVIEDARKVRSEIDQINGQIQVLEGFLQLFKKEGEQEKVESGDIITIGSVARRIILEITNSFSNLPPEIKKQLETRLNALLSGIESLLNDIGIPNATEKDALPPLSLLDTLYTLSKAAREQMAITDFNQLITWLEKSEDGELQQLAAKYKETKPQDPTLVTQLLREIATIRFNRIQNEVHGFVLEKYGITLEELSQQVEKLRKPHIGLTKLAEQINTIKRSSNTDEEAKRQIVDFLNNNNLTDLAREVERGDKQIEDLFQLSGQYRASCQILNLINSLLNSNQGSEEPELDKPLKKLIHRIKDLPNLPSDIRESIINNDLEGVKKWIITNPEIALSFFEELILGINPLFRELKETEGRFTELKSEFSNELLQRLREEFRKLQQNSSSSERETTSSERETTRIEQFDPNKSGSLLLAMDFRERLRGLHEKMKNQKDIFVLIIETLSGKDPLTKDLLEITKIINELIDSSKKRISQLKEDKSSIQDTSFLNVALAAHLKVLEAIASLPKGNSRQPLISLYILGGVPLIQAVIDRTFYTVEIY